MKPVLRRRLSKALLALVLSLFVLFSALFIRFHYFPPRFDVVSIANLPVYQSPALLERAWTLPVARTYLHELDFQANGTICGPTSVANAFRSLGEGPVTASALLAGSGKCRWAFCFGGLTLDDLADLTRSKSRRSVTVLTGLSMAEFRMHMHHTNDTDRRYLVNFQRGLLFGTGVGHHSPIAGYLEERDLVFVLDVNPKFGPWLVSAERLYLAMNSLDSSSGKARGLLLLQ
ncbi:MAG TPA: phytochelatin synthase family protein [Polyangiaceae bacterium]|nr:phytochelatin synthase family protein [Polyangiaceae bacterium]